MIFRITSSTLFFVLSAFAASAETLVVAVPETEFPALAEQMVDGANAALPDGWTIKPVKAGCTEDSAKGISDLITLEKPDAVIGLPCIESLMPALNTLGPANVPVITISSRAIAPSNLAVKNNWPLIRIGPRENEDGEAIGKLIVETWRDKPFAVINDGTIFARDTAEAIRNAGEAAGIKPVLFDGFQPQLENQKQLIDRIIASGATQVFIAGDRANTAQIAREAAGLNLTFAGPETLRASDLDFPLPEGVLMVARDLNLNPSAMAKIGAKRQTAFSLAEGHSLDAFIATEIAVALKANPALRRFSTSAGSMNIADDGFVEPVQYALFRYDGTAFQRVLP